MIFSCFTPVLHICMHIYVYVLLLYIYVHIYMYVYDLLLHFCFIYNMCI